MCSLLGNLSMSNNLVSVIIPCYNQAHFLKEAIESVLAQTYRHFEIIVVDDGSTDNTSEIAAQYRGILWLRQDNQGPSSARNAGISKSKGDFLVFIDADDRLMPIALEVGLNCLNANPDCAFVYGHTRLIAADGTFLSVVSEHHNKGNHYHDLLCHDYIRNPSCVVYRRSAIQAVKGYNVSLRVGEDRDLNLRITREFPICCHYQVVAEYRQHDKNTCLDSKLLLKSVSAVFSPQKKYIKGNKKLRQAYKSGIKRWKNFYGERLSKEVRTHLQAREWKKGMKGMMVLMQYYPRGFLKAVFSKLYNGN